MSIFGPHYPHELQRAMNRAERIAEHLSNAEVRNVPTAERARAWLVGRAEELETTVGCIVADWKARRLDDDQATQAVLSYLDTLETGAAEHLEPGLLPSDAESDLAATMPQTDVGSDVKTLPLPMTPSAPGDTLIDPAALLDDFPGSRRN